MSKKYFRAKMRNVLEQEDEKDGKYFSANMSFPKPCCYQGIPQTIETENFGLQYSSKPLFYLPTRLLCINRIVIVIEVVNVKVFSSGAWPLLVAASGFWLKCLRNPK